MPVFSKHLLYGEVLLHLINNCCSRSWYRTYYYTYRPYSRLSFLDYFTFFIRALVKQLNKFNAKIRIFLDAMEDKESMILFNEQSADKEMNALSHSLNRINELLATTKSQSRVQENFYHSLLEEVPNGVLAWNSEKRVLFVNGAALRLLGVESIIFLRQLEEQYPILKDFITHGNVENSFLFTI